MKVPTDLRAFIESLNAQKVKYVIVSGYAVGFHGHPRFTGDIDILIEHSAQNADRIVESLNLFSFRKRCSFKTKRPPAGIRILPI